LIEAGANLNSPDIYLATPLFVACENGHVEIVKTLIEAGANLNSPDKDGATPLFVACKNGHAEVVKALLEKQEIDLTKAFANGKTPLDFACHNGSFELIKRYDDDDETRRQIIGNVEVVKALFNGGADTSFLKQKNNFSLPSFFSKKELKFDHSSFTPEIKELIKKITDPKEIEIRDQNLRQIRFDKENANVLQSLTNDSNPTTNVPIDISETRLENPAQEARRDGDINKEVANCLLFLKFVASEFSSKTKSVLTSDEKKSKMLAIYLKNNEHASFIAPIIDNVIKNKDGLRDFLKNKSSGELINLSTLNSEQTNSSLGAEDRTQSTENIIKDKLRRFITPNSSSIIPPALDTEFVIAQPNSIFSCLRPSSVTRRISSSRVAPTEMEMI
jgi:ankyrin repeat protein